MKRALVLILRIAAVVAGFLSVRGTLPFMAVYRRAKVKRALVLILIIAAVVAGFLSVRGTLPFMAVFGKSMDPELSPGDLIIIESVTASEVNVGDIIAFTVPPQVREVYGYPEVVAHRVVKKYTTESGISFRTKGDNVSGEDPLAVRDMDLRGKIDKRISYLGFPLLFLQSRFGLISVIVALCALTYYLYAEEVDAGGRRAYRGLFAPVIEENRGINQLTERALSKFASAMETYGEHLSSHTSAIQGLSDASQKLSDSAAMQNTVLLRIMETVEQLPVKQRDTVLKAERPYLVEESAKEPLPSASIDDTAILSRTLGLVNSLEEDLQSIMKSQQKRKRKPLDNNIASEGDTTTLSRTLGLVNSLEEDLQSIIESQQKRKEYLTKTK